MFFVHHRPSTPRRPADTLPLRVRVHVALAAGLTLGLSATAALPASAAPLDAARPGARGWAAQSLAVGSADPAPGARDGYGSSVVMSGLAPYSLSAPTFTNDPTSAIQWPFTRGVPITSYFGPRAAPCRGCSTNHSGLDITPGLGTPVGVIADGVVVEVGNPKGELGVYAIVEHVIDGQRIRSVYAHMLERSLAVAVGDRVAVGQTVGLVGSSGQSTGPHLHLSITRDGQYLDPYAFLTARVGR
ncbi:MAG: M23 family metallopeptidase [Micrococcales bacterium]|nr:M23 family metallopeptidase [Micrococcales bacterium]